MIKKSKYVAYYKPYMTTNSIMTGIVMWPTAITKIKYATIDKFVC